MAENYFHLSLPFQYPLNKEGMKWFFNLPPCFVQVPNKYFNPEAVKFFESKNLIYWDAEVFSFPANYEMQIHVDNYHNNNINNFDNKYKCRLNWAYSEGEHHNLWFKPKPNCTPRIKTFKADNYDLPPIYYYLENEVIEIERTTVRTPTCIVIGQPHSVRTYKESRKAISVSLSFFPTQFKKFESLSISNMREILNDYIVD
jgi:hypothetical protein